MKNTKIKKFFRFKLWLFIILASLWTVYASDFFSWTILSQNASSVGSNGSNIQIISGEEPWYWNAWNNSTVIWNYFRWFYYDSVFWYFQLDWSGQKDENVSVVWSTTACWNWYWYKLWGFAYSPYYGFIDFDYSNNIFVYYCVDDSSLHGYAYNENIWFQNFEGIGFEIIGEVGTVSEDVSDGIFVNDSTKINLENFWDWNIRSYLWWDLIQWEDDKESIFYIIK